MADAQNALALVQAAKEIKTDLPKKPVNDCHEHRVNVEIRMPAYLASGAERVSIKCTVSDPDSVTTGGRLEVECAGQWYTIRHFSSREDLTPGKPLDIDWDGNIHAVTGAYPDGYVTISPAPYTVRLSVEAGPDTVGKTSDTTKFQVEIQDLSLELGSPDVVRDPRHQEVCRSIKAIPAEGDGTPVRVLLTSNLFSAGFSATPNEQLHSHSASFEEYQKLWGDGPMIPLLATVLVKSAVEPRCLPAPFALGRGRILWDYEDVPEPRNQPHVRARSFIDDAQEWHRQTTSPPGDNCPGDRDGTLDRGGKRTNDPDFRRVLPRGLDLALAQPFPYDVEVPATRRWALYGAISRDQGTYYGRSGVIFQPSRMAGDAYRICAYFDPDRQGDRLGDLPLPVRKRTGIFETWRQVDICAVWSRQGTTNSSFSLADVQPYYDKAFISLRGRPDSPSRIEPEDYHSRVIAVVKDLSREKEQELKEERSPSGRKSETFIEMTAVSLALLRFAVKDSGDGYAAVNVANFQQFQTNMPSDYGDREIVLHKINSADEYRSQCDSLGCEIANVVCDRWSAEINKEGIAIFIFSWPVNLCTDQSDGTRGQAVKRIRPVRTQGAYLQFAPNSFYQAPHSMAKTVAHEIGHLMFLPHVLQQENMNDAAAHDAADDACLMGYNYKADRFFCGYCLLRLRGWKHTGLKNGTANGLRQNAVRPHLAIEDGAIVNRGPAPLVVSAIQRVEGSEVTVGLPPGPLTTGRSYPLGVTWPSMSTGLSTSLEIRSNDPDSPHRCTLRQDGLVPQLQLTPDKKDFGIVYATDPPVNRTAAIRLTRIGDPAVQIQTPSITGPDADCFTVTAPSVASDVGGGLDVTVMSTYTSEGTKQAFLYIPSNAKGAPHRVPLTATHASGVKRRAFNPAIPTNIPAGQQAVFGVKSVGTGALTVQRISVISGPEGVSISPSPDSIKDVILQLNQTLGFRIQAGPRANGNLYLRITTDAPEGEEIHTVIIGTPPSAATDTDSDEPGFPFFD